MTRPALSDVCIRYLHRLGVNTPLPELDLALLSRLQTNHIHTFTHNTVDTYFKRPIDLNPTSIMEKFLAENRGGICFELNGAFCHLLQQIGYDAKLMPSHIWAVETRTYDLPLDTHAVIVVNLNGQQYLVDVGFADSFRLPINLTQKTYSDVAGHFKLVTEPEPLTYGVYKFLSEQWYRQYTFTLTPTRLQDLRENVDFVWSSPLHEFSYSLICTRSTPLGHIAVINLPEDSQMKRRLLINEGDKKEDITLTSFAEVQECLINQLGMAAEVIKQLQEPDQEVVCLRAANDASTPRGPRLTSVYDVD